MIRYLAALALLAFLLPGARSPGAEPATFDGRAERVLMTWRGGPGAQWQAALRPRQDLTIMSPGTAAALYADPDLMLVHGRPAVPEPSTGTVRWADGRTLELPLTSAEDAQYRAGPPVDGPPGSSAGRPARNPRCQAVPLGEQPAALRERLEGDGPPCKPAKITRVTLEQVTIRTHRGPAEVPAWRLDVERLPGPIHQVAVANAAIDPSPGGLGPTTPFDGTFEQGPGSTVILYFIRARCGRMLGVNVREEPDAVVVAPRVPGPDGPCRELGLLDRRTITLRSPLGDRPVLDARTGRPIAYGRLW
ncbi:hypothetical protein [Nonomuraea typhae]|uniref:Uncharacterized protein n=1 Tax=Nonomuraea typhae TaxID=2603600 RepID=A0ABW7Z4S1_9ACTN